MGVLILLSLLGVGLMSTLLLFPKSTVAKNSRDFLWRRLYRGIESLPINGETEYDLKKAIRVVGG